MYVEAFLKYRNSPIAIDKLNTKGHLQAYIMGHMLEGIGYNLLVCFKEKKTILGLEDLQEVSSCFESISFDSLKEGLQTKFGFGAEEDQESTQAYLKGQIPSNVPLDGEIKTRNLKWI